MSSAVAWGNTDARTQVVARKNHQRYQMIKSLTRGEEGLDHQQYPVLRCYLLPHDNWSNPKILQQTAQGLWQGRPLKTT